MKKLMIGMTVVFALGWIATASYAGWMESQSGYSPWTGGYQSVKSGGGLFESRASAIIGTYVQNKRGDYLGKITDLMIDPHDGRIAFVVLSHGGILGIPTRFVAVPFSALTPGQGKNVYLLDVSKEKMAAAPSFSSDHWPDVTNREWGAETYTYYGQTPYWEESEANCP
jgi:sporulation protein YlmC with PRC-barrel domain